MSSHRDLRLLVAAATICAIGSLIEPLGAARFVFAVPLALLLPGYAIAAAVFGRHQPQWPELLPLSVGLSLSALILGGVILNFTPGGLQAVPWVIVLVLVVVGGSYIAARRREPPLESGGSISLPRIGARTAVLTVGALVLTVGALVLSQTPLHGANALGYTELWLIPEDHSGAVHVGVTNQQQHTTDYRLRVEFADQTSPATRSLTLRPGESRLLRFDHPASSRSVRFEADLYRTAHPGRVYRRVFGWLQPSGVTG